MNEASIYPIFPKVVFLKNLSFIKDKDINTLISNCKKEKYINIPKEDSENVSYSSIDRYLFNNKKFKEIKNIILKEFNYFKDEILFYKNNDFKITTSWIARTEKNQQSNWHNHNNSFYSGVFYINVKENSGNIEFQNFENSRFLLNSEKYNILNSRKLSITPKNKSLIFFPSELYHKITKNNSNETRLSIAFNIVPIGTIGSGDSELVI